MKYILCSGEKILANASLGIQQLVSYCKNFTYLTNNYESLDGISTTMHRRIPFAAGANINDTKPRLDKSIY